MIPGAIAIDDRWRVSEDDEIQWVLQKLEGGRWRNIAWCGTRDGLLDVALPHNNIAAPAGVLDALSGLPDTYQPGV